MSNPWESPDSNAHSDDMDDEFEFSNLSLGQILFSFEGRIPRSTYWFANIGMGVGFYAVIFVFAMILGAIGVAEEAFMLLILVMYIPLLWCSLAIAAKRWHDRGKSGFFVLVAFIPLVGPLWQLVECGFLEGDPYRNQYGPRTT